LSARNSLQGAVSGRLAADRQKILGSKMGSGRPIIDVPMIVTLYREGRLSSTS
jgi:Zn-dependent alcohol dehydrogenase